MNLKHKKELQVPFHSLVHYTALPGSLIRDHKAGYLSPDGEFLPCGIYNHVYILEHFFSCVIQDFTDACIKENITLDKYVSPYELFFMVEMEFVKVSAIPNTSVTAINSDDLRYIWNYQWIYPLTDKQIRFLFPN